MYAAIMLKSKNFDRILRIYRMDRNHNPSLDEVINEVAYMLHSESDSSEVRKKIMMYILYVCVYICVFVYMCGHVYMYMYACVYVFVHLCVYTHV